MEDFRVRRLRSNSQVFFLGPHGIVTLHVKQEQGLSFLCRGVQISSKLLTSKELTLVLNMNIKFQI